MANTNFEDNSFLLDLDTVNIAEGTIINSDRFGVFWNVSSDLGVLTATYLGNDVTINVPPYSSVNFSNYSAGKVTKVVITTGTFHQG